MLTIPSDTVHLWHIKLDRANITNYAPFVEWLSVDELGSAQRMRFAQGYERFIGSRASLRWILSHYVNEKPETVQLQYGPSGKPTLQALASVSFNLSHCGDELLCAVSAHEVGVDLERSKKPVDAIALSQRFFALREAQLVVCANEPITMFYRIWTCKEAVLKAQGCGLTRHLSDVVIDITFADKLEIHSLPQDFCSWYLYQWEWKDHCFALAAKTPVWHWHNRSTVLSSLPQKQ